MAFAALGAGLAKAKSDESKKYLKQNFGKITGGCLHNVAKDLSDVLDVIAKVTNVAIPVLVTLGGVFFAAGVVCSAALTVISIANLAKRILL